MTVTKNRNSAKAECFMGLSDEVNGLWNVMFIHGAGYVELCQPLQLPGIMSSGKPLRYC